MYGKEIYLDNAATTPVHPDIAKTVMECMVNDYGNPSSLHRLGLNAEKKLKAAREELAMALGVNADGIFLLPVVLKPTIWLSLERHWPGKIGENTV